MNYNSILRILTIRYDPDKESCMKPLHDSDFAPLPSSDIESNLRCISKMLGILALKVWYKLFISKTMNRKKL